MLCVQEFCLVDISIEHLPNNNLVQLWNKNYAKFLVIEKSVEPVFIS